MNNRILNIKAVSFNVSLIIRSIKCNTDLILLLSLFISGLVIGTVSIQLSENYRLLFNSVFFVENNFIRVFINRFLINLTVLTANFVMGLCLVGSPFINFMSVLVGIYIGSMYSLQLFINGIGGIGKFILSDVLFYILMYIPILYSQLLSLKMSDAVKLNYCGINRGEVQLRSFMLKYAFVCIISVAIAFISAVFS